jgi:acyl-coenzyme A synthetase/AMP-(fatty) acid ligase
MLDRIRKSNYECSPSSRIVVQDLNFPVGFVFAIGMLSVGGAVIFPASNSAADAINAVRVHAATHWLLSPAQAQQIVDLLANRGLSFPELKHMRVVGAKPSPKLLNAIKNRITPNVFVPYGSTEMGPVSMATPETLLTHPDSCGRSFPWARVEMVDDADQPLPAGSSGRLRLQVEGMVTGYYRDSARSASQFRDGWFYPGDQARISHEGLLFIEGREDDVLNVSGKKILADDVESVLREHPAVVDAGAFMLAMKPEQEALVAAVILSSAASSEELKNFSAERLGPLSPQQIFVVDRFPRNTTGKLLRGQLADQVAHALSVSSAQLPH